MTRDMMWFWELILMKLRLKLLRENHGKAEAMKLDLFDHSNIDEIINFLEEKNIKLDVLVGGPCLVRDFQ